MTRPICLAPKTVGPERYPPAEDVGLLGVAGPDSSFGDARDALPCDAISDGPQVPMARIAIRISRIASGRA